RHASCGGAATPPQAIPLTANADGALATPCPPSRLVSVRVPAWHLPSLPRVSHRSGSLCHPRRLLLPEPYGGGKIILANSGILLSKPYQNSAFSAVACQGSARSWSCGDKQ